MRVTSRNLSRYQYLETLVGLISSIPSHRLQIELSHLYLQSNFGCSHVLVTGCIVEGFQEVNVSGWPRCCRETELSCTLALLANI